MNSDAGDSTCLFPTLTRETNPAIDIATYSFTNKIINLKQFYSQYDLSIARFFQVVWSIVLRQYADTDEIIFACGSPLKHLPLEDGAELPVVQGVLDPEKHVASLLTGGELALINGTRLGAGRVYNTALFLIEKCMSDSYITKGLREEGGLSHVDLAIVVEQGHDQDETKARLKLVYRSSLLSSQDAANIASTISQCVEQVIAKADKSVNELVLCSPSNERDLQRWNNRVWKAPGLSKFCSIVDYIRDQVSRQPQATAIRAWDGNLTYETLDGLSSRLARHLREECVGCDVKVVLTFEKSLLPIIAQIAVLKAGGVFVPVDPSLPAERMRTMIEQVGASIALASETTAKIIAPHVEKPITVSLDFLHCLPGLPPQWLPVAVAADHAAYILFTSGSTGQPKGCIMEHGALAQIAHQASAMHMRSDSRVLQFASYSFAACTADIWGSLTVGAMLCIPSADDRVNRLATVVKDMRITWACLTPSVVAALPDLATLSTLKTIILVGETVGRQHFAALSREGLQIHQALGCTEHAPVLCVSSPMRSPADCGVVGRPPVANVWLVDPVDRSTPVPVGAVGEIMMESAGLARCYLDAPERNSVAFVTAPEWLREIRGGHDTRVYRSGDMARYLSDGSLQYIARKDTQVKIRGQRVELAEIEYEIRRACNELDKVVVEAAVPLNSNGSQAIVAFIYMGSDSEGTAPPQCQLARASPFLAGRSVEFSAHVERVTASLATKLPGYMLPSAYLPLRHVPSTLTGKVDRHALRLAIRSVRLADLVAYDMEQTSNTIPRTELEVKLHRLFSTVLNVDEALFGVHDSFTRLGGDSLLAMRLTSLCELEGLPVNTSMILRNRTVGAIASALTTTRETETSPLVQRFTPESTLISTLADSMGIEKDNITTAFPVTPIQQGMLLSQMQDQRLYQARVVWRVRAHEANNCVIVDRFKKAWSELCRRHPILRTRISTEIVDGTAPYQVVLDKMEDDSLLILQSKLDIDSIPHAGEKNKRPSTGHPRLTLFTTDGSCLHAIIDINHVLMDGQSMSVMVRDLCMLYSNQVEQLPTYDQICNYEDYAAYLHSLDFQGSLEFWTSRLADMTTCILPSVTDSEAAPSTNTWQYNYTAVGDISKYQEFCEAHGVTLATLFKVAWGLVLRCYTGQETVVFGESVSGRDAPIRGIQDSIGPYIHQIPCQMEFSETTTVAQMLDITHAQFLDALSHKHVALADIQHALGVGGVKMFNTGLTIAPQLPWDRRSSSIEFEEVARSDPTEYDVVLEVRMESDSVQALLKYTTSAFDDEQASRMGKTLSHIIDKIINHPIHTVRNLQMVSPRDIEEIWCWNAEPVPTVRKCVHHLISDRAARQPAAQAVCAWDGSLTYSQLEEQSTRLAQHLVELGIKRGMIVPLLFEKSRWMPVAILAVMRAGAACVALDIVHPIERLRSIVQQVNAAVVLTSPRQFHTAQELNAGRVVSIESGMLDGLSPDGSRILPVVHPTEPLYLVFTSGSTGKPKGAIISHQNFASAVQYHQSAMGITDKTRVLDFVSYAFDIAWSNILHALTAGACLCIPSEDDRRSNISKFISDTRVTYAFVTPTVARLFKAAEIPSLRTLLCGGELLTRFDVQQWTRCGVDLRNTYGPAECTVISNSKSVNAAYRANPGLGRGVGCNLWIVDPNHPDRLMPIGCPGELWIEGPIVGAGYLDEPQKTAAAFFQHASWQGCDARPWRNLQLYRTGDIVRYDSQGNIVFVGRQDAKVKIRGQRVDLAEVEYLVERSLDTEVNLVADLILPAGSERNMLVLFVEANTDSDDGLQSQVAASVDRLRRELPAAMIPSAIIPVPKFPITSNGKTDRRELRLIGGSYSLERLADLDPSRAGYREPETEMERALQKLWAHVLKIKPTSISARDSFLAIGGDSIGIMQLIGAAREKGLVCTAADVFDNPRLEDLALCLRPVNDAPEAPIAPFSLLKGRVDIHGAISSAARQCGVGVADIEDMYPCTPLQEGLLSLTSRASGQYVDRTIYEIQGTIDLDRVARTWTDVIRSTPILRTQVVVLPQGGLAQVVLGKGPEVQRKSDLNLYLACEAELSMGLATPLARIALVESKKRGQNDTTNHLVLTLHHAAYDAWSVLLLLEKASALLQGQTPREDAPFTRFIKHIAETEDESSAYWRSQLSGAPTVPFPTLPSGTYQPRADSSLYYELTGINWGRGNITASTAIRASWALLASRYTNASNPTFGATVTGRQVPVAGVASIIAPTIATVPVRITIDEQMSIAQYLDQVQKQTVAMHGHEQVGLHRLRKTLPDVSENSHFDTLLVIQPAKEKLQTSAVQGVFRGAEDGSLAAVRLADATLSSFTSYALTLVFQPTTDGLDISFEYDSHVLSSTQISRLAHQFEHVVQQFCRGDTDTVLVKQVSVTSRRDLEEIIGWNCNLLCNNTQTPVHELIQESVISAPQALAIDSWDGTLTYAQLGQLSTRLSGHITRPGGIGGWVVALLFEKSLATPVAMLAVMKAGAASVALDATLPTERLQAIVFQAQASVVLASPSQKQKAEAISAAVSGCTIIYVDRAMLEKLPSTKAPRFQPQVRPSSPLYIVFTSGSTGQPKGVTITHGNICSAMQGQKARLNVGARVFDFASYAFDIAWFNFLKTTISGSCLCIAGEAERKHDIIGAMTRLQVDFACLTPSTARLLDPAKLPFLRTLLLAGEVPTRQDIDMWVASVALFNAYGPAECTPLSTMSEQYTLKSKPGNIGRGMGVNIWVVDQSDASRLAPTGSVGELWLEGPLVGPGYYQDPQKTAEAFLDDPAWFIHEPDLAEKQRLESRFYRTGDLVYHDDDGSLVFVGRMDNQIKIRGQRVELSEVEYHVQQVISVSGLTHGALAADVLQPIGRIEKLLVVFISAGSDTSAEALAAAIPRHAEGWTARLSQLLPVYMIPRIFLPLETLPITPSGKVDRQQLRVIGSSYRLEELNVRNHSREYCPPSTSVEHTLQRLWGEILGIPPESISTHDSFLHIGGDSVSAMQLVGMAREKAGLSFTVADIFSHARLDELAKSAKVIERTSEEVAPFSLLKPPEGPLSNLKNLAAHKCTPRVTAVEDIYTCTPLQEGMISATVRDPRRYIARTILEIQDDVDLTRFESACHSVLLDNPLLRTRIIDLPGQGMVQVVAKDALTWSTSHELASAVEQQVAMGLGTPLAYFTTVAEDKRRYVVLTIHHAIYDGWSMSLLLSAVNEAYQLNTIPKLRPFRDFIQHLADRSLDASKEFWTTQFDGLKAQPYPSLPIPLYQPQADATSRHRVSEIKWPTTGITRSTLVRSAWTLLMARYQHSSGSEDDSPEVLFGVTVTGRQGKMPGIERVVGPTIATVPVRVQLSWETSVATFLENIQRQAIEMIDHEQTGLQNIGRMSPSAESATGFQTLLVIQPPTFDDGGKDNVLFKPRDDRILDSYVAGLQSFSSYSLMLLVQLEENGLDIVAAFDSNVITAKEVERLLHQVEHVLKQLSGALTANAVDKRLAGVHTVCPMDLQDICSWNSIPAPLPIPARSVHHLVSERALQSPDSIAIQAWDGNMTYSQLESASTRVAYSLLQPEIGLTRGDAVALFMEKSMWTPILMVGAMKMGATVVLVSSSVTKARLDSLLPASGAKLVVSNVDDVSPAGIRTCAVMDLVTREPEIDSNQPFPEPHDPAKPAHILFTSGSTGVPKGIVWSHRALTANVNALQRFDLGSRSRVFQFVSYDFDVSIIETYAGLVGGACLCIPSESERLNQLSEAMSQNKANWVCMTPSTASTIAPDLVPTLKTCVFAGEVLPAALVEKWSRHTTIYNWYGPAECSMAVSCRVTGDESTWRPGVIGSPMGSACWVVDAADANILLPVGATGELLLQGTPVMDGYIGENTLFKGFVKPEWTSTLSISNSIRRKMYKTGDLVRYEADGNITYLGRKDAQVKIRGQRVELAEIESHVRQHLLSDAANSMIAAEVIRPVGLDPLLVVFIANGDTAITETSSGGWVQMTDHLHRSFEVQLPRYMWPQIYLPVDELPLTTSGKIDRAKLREYGASLSPEQLRHQQSGNNIYVAPKTAFELVLQELWAELLEIPPPSASDHFLRAGGDSISAMRLVSQLRERGLTLTITDIFNHSRLVDMAARIRTRETKLDQLAPFVLLPENISSEAARAYVAKQCGLSVAVVENLYPCTPLQEGMISLTGRRRNKYISRSVIELQSHVDVGRFKKAWTRVLHTVPILRTRVVDLTGCGLVQAVIRQVDEEDMWFVSHNLERYLAWDTHVQMGLNTPLARFGLIHDEGDGRHYLVPTIHHALYDGWSFPLVLEEVKKVYYNMEGAGSLLSFDHFIQYLTTQSDPSYLEGFWKKEFANLSAVPFPALPTSKHEVRPNSTISHSVSGLSWSSNGITPSTVVRTALAVLTAHYQQSSDVVFGATVTGRQAPVEGIEKIMGPTIATVPVRICFDWQNSLKNILSQVQDQAISMLKYEQTGLQVIQRVSEEAERAVQFQTLLVVQPASYEHQTAETEDDIFVPMSEKQRQDAVTALRAFSVYGLMVVCQLKPAGMELAISFDDSVFSHRQVIRIAQHLEHLVREICAGEDKQPVSSLRTLSQRDSNDIMEWNSHMPCIEEKSVAELIARRALVIPDRMAIDAWDGKMTYSELDAKSGAVVEALSHLGIQAGDVVGLHFRKSVWMPVCMLALMKLRVVALPFSHSQGKARIETIVGLVAPKIILTNIPQHASDLAPRRQDIADLLTKVFARQSRRRRGGESPSPCKDSTCPDGPAHIQFTSGSTGIPKGIVWDHRSLTANIQTMLQRMHITSETRVFQFVSYDFDVSNLETYATFAAGACLCIPSEDQRTNELCSAISSSCASWIFLTPSAAELVAPDKVPSLQTLVFGGELLARSAIDRWVMPDLSLLNWYGPGECAGAALCEIQADSWTPGMVGPSLASTCWIVDPSNVDVLLPVGATGELLLNGPTMMTDYFTGTAEGSDHFVVPKWLEKYSKPDQIYGKGLYRTGDMVRYTDDGTIIFVGRRDGQVKINGQRVELTDIESNIRSLMAEHGADVPVVAQTILPSGSKKVILVAFMSMSDQSDKLNELMSIIWEQLCDGLPRHMVPRAYIAIDSIPLTSNGKVDRKKLKAMGESYSAEDLARLDPARQSGGGRVPSTPIELTLRDLWASVIKIDPDKILAHYSFLQVGGDSIAAMRLVGAARHRGIVLSVADIFKTPRLEDMAKHAQENGSFSHEDSEVEQIAPFTLLPPGTDRSEACRNAAKQCGVDTTDIEDMYPCTALQEGLLAITNLRPGEYVSCEIRKLDKDVEIPRLHKAVRELISRLAILRTRIVDLPGAGLTQVVVSTQSCAVQAYDSVAAFHEEQTHAHMGLGTQLNRFTFIEHDGERYLGWTIHHALYDGWSMPLMLQQLRDLYLGLPAQILSPFSGFIKYLSSSDSSLLYWELQLNASEASPYPSLPSPSYQPRADKTFSFSVRELNIESLGDITVSTLVRAAWAVLTAQYTNSTDVIFGSTMTGRQVPIAGIEKMIGPTITTVPVRVSFSWDMSVDDYLSQVQQQMVDMIPYEQVGLQTIRQISPTIDRASQFQTLLVVQPGSKSTQPTQWDQIFDYDAQEERADGLLKLTSFTSYAMMWLCEILDGEVELSISFDSKVLPREEVRLMAEQLGHVIRTLASSATASACLGKLDLLSETHRNALWKINATVPSAQDRPVNEMFSQSARLNPNAHALDAWDGQLTYSELHRLSSQLASRLVAIGARSSVTIPICIEKSIWMPVSMLAVLKAGAAFVQLSSSIPPRRIEQILKIIRPPFALTSAKQSEKISSLVDTYIPQELLDASTVPETEFYPPALAADEAANVLFTSGSTGVPKPIVWSHRTLSTNVVDVASKYEFTPSSRVVQFAAYDFDVSVIETLATLLRGGCLCIPSEKSRQQQLTEMMKENRVNLAVLTPSVSNILSPEAVPDLEKLVLCGEPMTSQHVDKWAGRVRLFNWYGPAECSSTSGLVVDPKIWATGDIGAPSACCCWVVDPQNANALLPIGAVGELLVEGPVQASTVLDQSSSGDPFVTPEWLAEGPPSRTGRHNRLYKTGDLARLKPDGSLTLVGRKDSQVKIRGQRVELAEVERHVRAHFTDGLGVPLAAELLTPSGAGNVVLVVFLAIGGDVDIRNDTSVRDCLQRYTEGLVNRLATAVPPYMVPHAFIPVSAIPMTATDKVDRRRLREIGQSYTLEQLAFLNSTTSSSRFREPETETQRVIQDLWGALLNLDSKNIGLDNNFLLLGGDSIKAMQLVRAAREAGLPMVVSDCFLYPCLADLARAVDEKGTQQVISGVAGPSAYDSTRRRLLESPALAELGLPAEALLEAYPVTDFQKFYISALHNNTLEKWAYCYMDLPPGQAIAVVEECCRQLWMQMDILRMVFIELDGGPVQALFSHFQPVISVHEIPGDISNGSEEIYRADFDQRHERGSPVTRFFITHNPQGHVRMCLGLSHAQFDGMSLATFASVFGALCSGDEPAPNPSFSNYLSHLDETRGQAYPYWRSLLSESKPTTLFPSVSKATVAKKDAILLRDKIVAPAPHPEYTPATIFTALCARAIGRLTKSSDIVFGYLTTGRPCLPPHLQSMAGPCLNIVPLRIPISLEDNQSGYDTFAQTLSTTQTQRLRGYETDSDQLSDIIANCTSWTQTDKHSRASESEGHGAFHFPFGVHFLNIEDELATQIHGHDVRIVPYTPVPAITFPTIILAASPCGAGQWEVEVRGGGAFYSKEDLEMVLGVVVAEIEKY